MREIKFRAWDSDTECFTYSDQEDDNYVWGFEDGKLKAWVIRECPGTLDEPPGPECVELEKPEQYIGLKDNNSKEIYEADIQKYGIAYRLGGAYRWDVGIVIFEHGEFLVEWKHRPYRLVHGLGVGENIGNIHENPELI